MKKIAIILTSFFLAFGLSAQEGQPLFMSVDKLDGQYHKGDTAYVTAFFCGSQDTVYNLEVKENGKTVTREQKEFKAGQRVDLYQFSYDNPTAVLINAVPAGTKEKPASVGFIFEAEGFRPGLDPPADLAEFWQKQVKKLRKTKIKPELVPVGKNPKVESYDLTVNMPEGRDVHAYISFPKDRSPKSHPIIVSFHGAGVRSSVLGTVEKRAQQGFIAIDINAHGILNGQPSSYYKELDRGVLKNYRREQVVDHKSYYFRLMFLRAQRVIDYATTLKEWDGKHIIAVGTSQGGLQSIAISAIDPRVSACFPTVPAYTDIAGSISGHSDSWPKIWRNTYTPDSPEYRVLPYYDAACLITLVKCPVFIEAGLVDVTCPVECVYSAYNVCPSEQKEIRTFPWRRHVIKEWTPEIKAQWNRQIESDKTKAILEAGGF